MKGGIFWVSSLRAIRYLYKLRSVCLSEAAEESGFLLKFHDEDRVDPILDQATESISGSTPDVYQKLYRALALTAHEYQKIDWFQ